MRNWIGPLGLVLAAVLVCLPARASAGEVRVGVGAGVTISTRYGDFHFGYSNNPRRQGGDRCGTPQVNRRIYEQRYGRPYQGSGYPASWVLNGGLSSRSPGYGPGSPGYGRGQPGRSSRYYREDRYGYPYRYPPMGGPPPVVVIVPGDKRDDIEHGRRRTLESDQDEQEYLAILLDQLRSRNREECEKAIDALARLSSEKREKRIREALEKVLREDPRVEIRRKVAEVLGEMGDEAVLSALENTTKKDPDQDVREEAARAIEKIRFAKPLSQLQSDDRGDREKAVEKLAKLPYPERVIEILGRVLLSDPEPDVRKEAAEQLGKTKNPRALPVLKRAGSDPDEKVRKEVEKAVARIKKALKTTAPSVAS
jgi:hypothetical protein